jgi:oligopeptide/dipeptide ABC transporter ATP-binding protein
MNSPKNTPLNKIDPSNNTAPQQGDPLLVVKDLIKHYPLKASGFSFSKEKVHALNGISFTVNRGEILGLVGESGCGKTTTGRSLLRMIEPDSGQVYFNRTSQEILDFEKKKEDFNSLIKPSNSEIKKFSNAEERINFSAFPKKQMRKERLKLQYIFQDPYQSLNPKQQIGRIITEAPVEHGHIKSNQWESTALKYLDLVGLPREALHKYPHEFSGGQRQRINIARAVALQPEFIVCDEPVSSLDVSIQSQILNLLLDIQKELGTAYLFIAHNLSVVFYLCDKVAVMYAGNMVEEAPSRELYNNPRHPYTELLMAAAPKIDGKPLENPPGLEGEVPSLIQLPRGCAFQARCPLAIDKCKEERPQLKELSPNHRVACFRAHE